MRILGARVRAYRKTRGLSQKELAKGICTQATISLVEKRNKIPSMQILLKLCGRLGIQLADVIIETDDQTAQVFRQVGELIRCQDLDGAATRLATVKLQRLSEDDQFKAYYYYHGELQLLVHHDADEAIFNFGMLLNEYASRTKDMYTVMARVGLGLAYADKGAMDKGELFISQAIADLKSFDTDSYDLVQDQIYTLLRAARFLQDIGNHQRALVLMDKAIQLSDLGHSLFLLEEVYETKAVSQLELADKVAAQKNLYIAYALAVVTNNKKLLTSVTQNVSKYQIPPLAL
ncbi:helix-turn-helix domain-containing protein [Furfurilactobacillus sp. WILCCON 0119]